MGPAFSLLYYYINTKPEYFVITGNSVLKYKTGFAKVPEWLEPFNNYKEVVFQTEETCINDSFTVVATVTILNRNTSRNAILIRNSLDIRCSDRIADFLSIQYQLPKRREKVI